MTYLNTLSFVEEHISWVEEDAKTGNRHTDDMVEVIERLNEQVKDAQSHEIEGSLDSSLELKHEFLKGVRLVGIKLAQHFLT